MNDFSEILAKGYESYLLHDVFAKIIPGLYFILFTGSAIGLDLGLTKVFNILFLCGIAWILSFTFQTLGTEWLIKDKPKGVTEEEWKRLMHQFYIKFKDSRYHMSRRNRYMVIKEASGNLAVAIFLVFLFLWIILGMKNAGISYQSDPDVFLIIEYYLIIIPLGIILIKTNRDHARRQRKFIEECLSENESNGTDNNENWGGTRT